MAKTYIECNFIARGNLHPAAFHAYGACKIITDMERGRFYFKEWRKFRHLTQNQVIDRLALFDDPMLPQTAASLSRIENGRQPYGQRILEALAEVYEVQAHELIGRNPEKSGELIDLFDTLDARQKEQAKALIKALAIA